MKVLLVPALVGATVFLGATRIAQADGHGAWDGWYVQGSVGAAVYEDTTTRQNNGNASDSLTTFDTGFGISGALGYGQSTGLRLEGEFSYSTADISSIAVGTTKQNDNNGEAVSMSLMFNALYGFDMFGFNPYVGAGAGLTRYHLDNAEGASFVATEDTQTTPSVQFMVGVDKQITESLALGLGYKYLISSEFSMHASNGTRFDQRAEQHVVAVRLRHSF